MSGSAARRAAWDSYVALTQGLLPALAAQAHDRDGGVNPALGAVAIRVRRYAPMWAEHGPMLIAAVDSAVRLFRHGDYAALEDLLQVLARRLYLLSAGPPVRPGGNNRKAVGPPNRMDPPKYIDPQQDTPST